MSREIKFRAWNDVAKVMYESNIPGLLIHFDSELNGLDENGMLEGTDNTKQHQIMQYTGLKDKNGKEIYEGDILEISMGAGSPLRCSIEYKAPSFCRRWIDKVSRNRRPMEIEPMAWNTHIIYKVIGNIYENPELLEGTA